MHIELYYKKVICDVPSVEGGDCLDDGIRGDV